MFNLIIAILFISIHISHSTNAQGSLTKIEGNYTGVLNFFNTPTTTTPTIKHPLPQFSGLRSNQTEGLNASEGWYVEKNTKVRGFIKEAYLAVSWGILLGEIVENYNFQWKSTGKYEIEFYDREGKFQKLFITREKLQKYPDLLKRFDYIQPTNISFEIDWASSNLDNDKKNSFKSEYNITGDIGSSSVGYVKDGHRTTVPSHMQLFFPSGQEPLSVPSIRQTGWKGFMGLPDNISEDKLRAMKKYFSIANEQSISSFRATENKWPLGEFKAIAEAFLRYESGEGLPKSPGELVDSLSTSVNQYDKTDEWSEPYTEPFDIKINKENNSISYNDVEKISGVADADGRFIKSGTYKINGKVQSFSLENGNFLINVPLIMGLNELIVTIGKEQKVIRIVRKLGGFKIKEVNGLYGISDSNGNLIIPANNTSIEKIECTNGFVICGVGSCYLVNSDLEKIGENYERINEITSRQCFCTYSYFDKYWRVYGLLDSKNGQVITDKSKNYDFYFMFNDRRTNINRDVMIFNCTKYGNNQYNKDFMFQEGYEIDKFGNKISGLIPYKKNAFSEYGESKGFKY